MGSKKFTFIELHLDGEAQFGPRSIGEALPVIGSEADATEETETDLDADTDEDVGVATEDDSRGKPIAAIVGLLVFIGFAIAFKKFRSGNEDLEDFEERDEPDVIVN